MGTPYTYGLAATQKVAVGGPFLNGHVIEVEPMEQAYGGHIVVDNEVVLASHGSLNVGGVAIVEYNDRGQLPDKAASEWDRNIVHMHLPRGIELTVFRWGNYLDLTLEMPPLSEGQDGSCGNFNGNPDDDSTQEVFRRIGARVRDEDLLFGRHAQVLFSHEMEQMLRTKCEPDRLLQFERDCRRELQGEPTATEVNACVFDNCFGANEHALQTAKTFATPEDEAAAHGANPL
eukprot:SRR837773.2011.p2 GENE.SRR837773.2011~~SRR837773.2011.p2  ORF type:complete len:268 (+),score=101.24 SRR837773.2011:111-806(+)